MWRHLYTAMALLLGASAGAYCQTYYNGVLVSTQVSIFSQIGPGPQRDGASAAGAKVSLMGTGTGTPTITCPYVGATWRISGGGIFSTFASPGNITPEIAFGSFATSFVITNIVAGGSNSSWRGYVKIVCGAIGTSGTMYVPEGNVNYASGTLLDGSAPLNQVSALTGDNTGPMAIGVNVTMATANAANKFRLDGLTIERLQ